MNIEHAIEKESYQHWMNIEQSWWVFWQCMRNWAVYCKFMRRDNDQKSN